MTNWTPPELDPARELRELLPSDGWRAAMDAIGRRHDLDVADAAPFATGSDVVWRLGTHVVKLTAPEWEWQLEAEAHWLAQVADRLPVRTAEPVARDRLAGWPYVVTSLVPGVALGDVWGALDHGERARLAGALGRLTRALHRLDVEPFGDDWPSFWRACRQDVSKRHAGRDVPASLADEVAPFLARRGELPRSPLVALHTELLDQHVLVDRRDGRLELAGLVDFADARLGPAEYDFPAPVEFLFRGERGLLRAFLEGYGYAANELGRETSRRLLAWGLSHRCGSLARMLRAIAPARPVSLDQLAEALYGTEG